MAVDWISDSDGSDNFNWDSDDDAEALSAPASRSLDAPGPSTLAWQDPNEKVDGVTPSASLVGHFVAMGFTKEMVLKAVKQNGDSDTEALLELLLTYKEMQAIDGEPSVGNCSSSACAPQIVVGEEDDEDDFNWDEDETGGGVSDDGDFLQEMAQSDEKITSLVQMGFPEDEAKIAITRCGMDASIEVLADSIYAAQIAGDSTIFDSEDTESYYVNTFGGMKKRKRDGSAAQGGQVPFHDRPMLLPNPMVGFGLPDGPRRERRDLPDQAYGPPFFYYENVALAPKGVWSIISRHLYDIEPEFVDSKYFCAAARKRGYIHNLPIQNRSPLLPRPPKTIFDAFPPTKKWWPSWDTRTQLNCLQTCVGSAKLQERIRSQLAGWNGVPPSNVQKLVMEECRKWNLLWVGKNKTATLEPDEIEFLLGFPKNHTRGITRTERYKSLGNSFQLDTVAYHLSVLRDMFPRGINVLSLFSGIGGSEVVLHRLGIRMKTVISVEISPVNRSVLKSWWEQTQTGTLIEIADVRTLTTDRIASFIGQYGGFDLVIGGSPCNNLAGSNRHHRDGLEGEHSALFFEYTRILDTVKMLMARH